MKITRSELREKIMTILYQINVYKKEKIEWNLENVINETDKTKDPFIEKIVKGVLEKENELDEIINRHMKEWQISRLGNIDKAIFRMSTFELLFTDTPKIVSINEGIELAKKYSDERVTKMLNGVLDSIMANEVIDE